VSTQRGHAEGRIAVEEAVSLSMNEGLRVSMDGYTWARMRNSAATRVAAERLRAEDRPETLAADAHADVIVPDGDPLEDIGLLADPAAHMALVIQAGAVSGLAWALCPAGARGRRRAGRWGRP
jgi:hypothetical protein